MTPNAPHPEDVVKAANIPSRFEKSGRDGDEKHRESREPCSLTYNVCLFAGAGGNWPIGELRCKSFELHVTHVTIYPAYQTYPAHHDYTGAPVMLQYLGLSVFLRAAAHIYHPMPAHTPSNQTDRSTRGPVTKSYCMVPETRLDHACFGQATAHRRIEKDGREPPPASPPAPSIYSTRMKDIRSIIPLDCHRGAGSDAILDGTPEKVSSNFISESDMPTLFPTKITKPQGICFPPLV
ncbi:hypothetical protein F5Y12DRAFT_710795 [Xylaria sp. FL1777]|nr:hypothetical protein F5Y12DRAFT_710795 [Xylaria sp. FL1777]